MISRTEKIMILEAIDCKICSSERKEDIDTYRKLRASIASQQTLDDLVDMMHESEVKLNEN